MPIVEGDDFMGCHLCNYHSGGCIFCKPPIISTIPSWGNYDLAININQKYPISCDYCNSTGEGLGNWNRDTKQFEVGVCKRCQPDD